MCLFYMCSLHLLCSIFFLATFVYFFLLLYLLTYLGDENRGIRFRIFYVVYIICYNFKGIILKPIPCCLFNMFHVVSRKCLTSLNYLTVLISGGYSSIKR